MTTTKTDRTTKKSFSQCSDHAHLVSWGAPVVSTVLVVSLREVEGVWSSEGGGAEQSQLVTAEKPENSCSFLSLAWQLAHALTLAWWWVWFVMVWAYEGAEPR